MTFKDQLHGLVHKLCEHVDPDVRQLSTKIFSMADDKLADYLINHLNDEAVQAAAAKIMDIVRKEKGDDYDDSAD